MTPEDYARALAHAACAIGNTSSFIREGSFLGTPAVLVGTRQTNRERGSNILEAGNDSAKIQEAIQVQLDHGKYESSDMYGGGNASRQIAEILTTVNPPIQKNFYDI